MDTNFSVIEGSENFPCVGGRKLAVNLKAREYSLRVYYTTLTKLLGDRSNLHALFN